MGFCTEIIIYAPFESKEVDGADDVYPAIDHVNQWLQEENHVQLQQLPEMDLFGASIKNLNVRRFTDLLLSTPWQDPESVQILVSTEDDPRMTIIDLFPSRVVKGRDVARRMQLITERHVDKDIPDDFL